MFAIGNTSIYDGIALHDWNEAQLAEIQDELARLDFLHNYRLVMEDEALDNQAPTLDFFKSHRRWVPYSWSFSGLSEFSMPNGWLDENKSNIVAIVLASSQTVDPQVRRVFPESADALENRAKAFAARGDAHAPWNIFFTISAPSLLDATPVFARPQVWADEARIACALERYRLAHGVYPDSLEALIPACIDEVPHDIMNGEPYRYRVSADGTFQLYSVGWNETDDGGKVVYKKDEPTKVDLKEGDWVWPTAQIDSTKTP
jgi:hypothetical protein